VIYYDSLSDPESRFEEVQKVIPDDFLNTASFFQSCWPGKKLRWERPAAPLQANGNYYLILGNDCGVFTVSALLEIASAFLEKREPVLPTQREMFQFRHLMAAEILTYLETPAVFRSFLYLSLWTAISPRIFKSMRKPARLDHTDDPVESAKLMFFIEKKIQNLFFLGLEFPVFCSCLHTGYVCGNVIFLSFPVSCLACRAQSLGKNLFSAPKKTFSSDLMPCSRCSVGGGWIWTGTWALSWATIDVLFMSRRGASYRSPSCSSWALNARSLRFPCVQGLPVLAVRWESNAPLLSARRMQVCKYTLQS
jgi:hypothetical protein